MRIRLGIVAGLAALAVAGSAGAQAAPTARQLELAQRYVAAMRMEKTMTATMDAMTPSLMASAGELPPEKRAMLVAAVRDVTQTMMATMSARMAPILAEVFTEKELEDVVAFYEGPSGRSMIDKSPQLAAKMAPVMQEIMPQVRAQMTERICKIAECPPEAKAP